MECETTNSLCRFDWPLHILLLNSEIWVQDHVWLSLFFHHRKFEFINSSGCTFMLLVWAKQVHIWLHIGVFELFDPSCDLQWFEVSKTYTTRQISLDIVSIPKAVKQIIIYYARTDNHEHIQPYPHFVHFKLMVETREL